QTLAQLGARGERDLDRVSAGVGQIDRVAVDARDRSDRGVAADAADPAAEPSCKSACPARTGRAGPGPGGRRTSGTRGSSARGAGELALLGADARVEAGGTCEHRGERGALAVEEPSAGAT